MLNLPFQVHDINVFLLIKIYFHISSSFLLLLFPPTIFFCILQSICPCQLIFYPNTLQNSSVYSSFFIGSLEFSGYVVMQFVNFYSFSSTCPVFIPLNLFLLLNSMASLSSTMSNNNSRAGFLILLLTLEGMLWKWKFFLPQKFSFK